MSSVLVRMCPRMVGSTTSRSCCQDEAPAIRATSRCDFGTEVRAAEYSSTEKAVPRQMLKMTMAHIGWSSTQAWSVVPRMALSVPLRRSSKACQRNATTEPGRIQASRTSTVSTGRTTRLRSAEVPGEQEAQHVLPDHRRPEDVDQGQVQRAVELRVGQGRGEVAQPDEGRGLGTGSGQAVVEQPEVEGPDRGEDEEDRDQEERGGHERQRPGPTEPRDVRVVPPHRPARRAAGGRGRGGRPLPLPSLTDRRRARHRPPPPGSSRRSRLPPAGSCR